MPLVRSRPRSETGRTETGLAADKLLILFRKGLLMSVLTGLFW